MNEEKTMVAMTEEEKALGRDLTFPQDKDKNLDEIAQDYVDGVKEYNPEPTWDLMQTAVCYGYHYCEQKMTSTNCPLRNLGGYMPSFAKRKKPHR